MWWWIDTGWACGGIKTIDNIVVEGAPIFRKLFGQSIGRLQGVYKLKMVSDYGS